MSKDLTITLFEQQQTLTSQNKVKARTTTLSEQQKQLHLKTRSKH